MSEIQVVAFRLDNEEYAVNILAVQEIIRPTAITRVPKAPEFVQGVINLRGIVVPVINLRKRFDLEDKKTSDKNQRIIILNIDEIRAGITVDSVTEVLRINQENIEHPDLDQTIDKKFIDGVGKYENRLLILLNVQEILDLAKYARASGNDSRE